MTDSYLPEQRPNEREWELERRAFVADERDRVADERELALDERERGLGRDEPDAARESDPAGQRRAEATRRRDQEARRRGAPGTDRLLAREFADLAVSLYAADTLDDVLERLVQAAAEAVPGCDSASVTFSDGVRAWTAAATDDLARAADQLQYDAGEGPCLEALRAPVVHGDDASWERWPRFAASRPPVVEEVLSCGFLVANSQTLGALNVYRRTPGRLDESSREAALILTAHGAVAVATAQEREAATRTEGDLRRALATRDVIAQAKGILMGRQGISADDAFDMLRRASQRLNVKLREVARQVSEGAEIFTGGPEALDADRLAWALSEILERAHSVPPDRIPDLGQFVAEGSGVRSTTIWLADYEQRKLLAFCQPPDVESFDIDGTVGGRAYLLGETVELKIDDGVRLWAPLINGIERLGVVRFDLDWIDEQRRGTLNKIAKLLASEIVTRGQYTDVTNTTRRTRDMSLSAELQWNLLRPPAFTTSDITIAASLEPSYLVAGDGYDYAYNEGVLYVCIFDSVGHDLRASLVANLLVATYRWCRRRHLDLEDTAQTIDEVLNDQLGEAHYGTAILAELDVGTGEFQWVNCGHPAPILIREDRVVGSIVGTVRPPLALSSYLGQQSWGVNGTMLQPGDRVVLYTDGVVEARTASGEDFGLDRLQEFIHRAIASGQSAAETVRRLAHAVVDHHDANLRDDATTLLLHWHPQRGSAVDA